MRQKLLLTFFATAFALCSWANGVIIDGINYVLTSSNKTACVTYTGSHYSSNNTYTGSVVIPETVTYDGTTYSVTSIGNNAFEGCTGLTSITIPNSVTSIKEYAFSGCTGLTSITISNSVTSIGWGAFKGCTGLTSITIPNSVTSIKEYAFSGCTGLTSVSIPNSVTSIGDGAFSGCTGLTSITIPNSVTSIGRSAFEGCTGLTSITIPNSVTSIGGSAFEGCTGLTSISIPNSVTSIGGSAFEGCIGLTSVMLNSNSIASNGSNLKDIFGNQVSEYIIGNSVTSIGWGAFKGCTGLTSITIPNSVTSIGGSAFVGCTGLTTITIPESVTSIGGGAFGGCTGLTSITIPNSVTSIGNNAFEGCTGLTSITIPNSVTNIGGSAFVGCTGLTTITIPNSVTNIGWSAFKGCTGLTSITINNSVIGSSMFEGCTGLTSITIPNSVTSIEYSAFEGCTSLTSITINNSVIGKSMFKGCTGLTSITIPNSVTSIGNNAFEGCTGLTSITIPESVTSIGGGAFGGCTGLTTIILNSNSIASNGSNLKDIFGNQVSEYIIGNSVTSIGYRAFNGCTGLTSITIPNSVTSIGGSAFEGCTGLASITIPNSVTSIGGSAFENCSSEIVILPKSVSIGYYCFANSSGYGYSNVYTFADNVLEISNFNHDSYFKNCNVYPGSDIMSRSISQSTISISPSSRLTAKTVKMDGRVFNAEDGNIQCTQLTPNKTYTLTVTGQVRDCDSDYTFDVDLTTEDLSLWLKQTDATNITLSVEGDNEGDAQIVGYSFLANEAQNSGNLAKGKWKAKGLKPKQRVQVDMTARTIDGYTKTITRYFDTKDLDVTFDAQTTGTSAMLTGSASMIDATYLSSCFKESGRDQVIIYGLDPYSSYSWPFYVTTKEGGEVPYYTSFRTQGLYINTQSAQPLTTTKARLIANTNCDDDALRCGFEWIRYDAPAEMKPTSVSCPVYNGVIMGTLNGVNPDTYYKYRPYYQSDSGKRYYGDWVAFITGDASVYFEPEIHTLAASDITSNSAKVRGYAVAGSDDISEQGFEYWTETSGTQRKESSGTLMQTTLSGLMPSTKYFYRSYAKTGTKTTYGEERDFTTNPDATGIEFISTDTPERTVIGYYNLQGQRTSEPQRGLNIIRYSDGTSKKVLVK